MRGWPGHQESWRCPPLLQFCFLYISNSSLHTHVYTHTHTHLFSNYKSKAFETMLNTMDHQKMQTELTHPPEYLQEDTKCWGDWSHGNSRTHPQGANQPVPWETIGPQLLKVTPQFHSRTYEQTQRSLLTPERRNKGPEDPRPLSWVLHPGRSRSRGPVGSHMQWHHRHGLSPPPCPVFNHTHQADDINQGPLASPRGRVTISGDIFGRHNWGRGATGI